VILGPQVLRVHKESRAYRVILGPQVLRAHKVLLEQREPQGQQGPLVQMVQMVQMVLTGKEYQQGEWRVK
jgi:hypothetical protein